MRFPSGDSQPKASTSAPVDPAPRPPPDVRVLRVSQIDAGRLDAELTSLLREQLLRVFARVHPGAVAHRTPELTLGLDLLVFYFTVWSHRPTPGMELMNLRYRDERRPLSGKSGMEGHRLSVAQRLAHGVAFVAGRFLWSKLTRAVHDARWSDAEPHTWRHRAWRAVGHAENAHAVASLVNLLLFLRSGRFRTPWERISRARLVYREPNTARVVSFEYLNRQILWRELSDLALFLLPMLDPARLRDAAARAFQSRDAASDANRRRGAPVNASNASASETGPARSIAVGDETEPEPEPEPCAACAAKPPTAPFAAEPCGHVHCYYCAMARHAADPARFRCARCDARVVGVRRVR